MSNEYTPDFISLLVDVCIKPHHKPPKPRQLTVNMFELDFTGSNIEVETVLEILKLLLISKNFKNLELVIANEQGLLTYTPKTENMPDTLYKVGQSVNVSFTIYIYL